MLGAPRTMLIGIIPMADTNKRAIAAVGILPSAVRIELASSEYGLWERVTMLAAPVAIQAKRPSIKVIFPDLRRLIIVVPVAIRSSLTMLS